MEKVASAIVLRQPVAPAEVQGWQTRYLQQCIGPVGEVIGEFGRTYGMLSEVGAHVGPMRYPPLVRFRHPVGRQSLATPQQVERLWAEIADLYVIARDILDRP
jgi:hypothetical protein